MCFSPVCGFPLLLECLCSESMTLLFSAIFNFYAFQYLTYNNFMFTLMLDFGIKSVFKKLSVTSNIVFFLFEGFLMKSSMFGVH